MVSKLSCEALLARSCRGRQLECGLVSIEDGPEARRRCWEAGRFTSLSNAQPRVAAPGTVYTQSDGFLFCWSLEVMHLNKSGEGYRAHLVFWRRRQGRVPDETRRRSHANERRRRAS